MILIARSYWYAYPCALVAQQARPDGTQVQRTDFFQATLRHRDHPEFASYFCYILLCVLSSVQLGLHITKISNDRTDNSKPWTNIHKHSIGAKPPVVNYKESRRNTPFVYLYKYIDVLYKWKREFVIVQVNSNEFKTSQHNSENRISKNSEFEVLMFCEDLSPRPVGVKL